MAAGGERTRDVTLRDAGQIQITSRDQLAAMKNRFPRAETSVGALRRGSACPKKKTRCRPSIAPTYLRDLAIPRSSRPGDKVDRAGGGEEERGFAEALE